MGGGDAAYQEKASLGADLATGSTGNFSDPFSGGLPVHVLVLGMFSTITIAWLRLMCDQNRVSRWRNLRSWVNAAPARVSRRRRRQVGQMGNNDNIRSLSFLLLLKSVKCAATQFVMWNWRHQRHSRWKPCRCRFPSFRRWGNAESGFALGIARKRV
jgi:hypothetical protein